MDDIVITPSAPELNELLQPPRATIVTWLRLMRLPTVFTALANVLCGYLLTHDLQVSDFPAQTNFWLLLISGAVLYLGGMVLNDVCDAKLDSIERPERPIPSGRISRKNATLLAVVLMAVGVTSAAFVGSVALGVAALLTVSIITYDAYLKKTIAGCAGMGACRFLNILLGASATASWSNLLQQPQLGVAASLFVYVLGVTWFARHEAIVSAGKQLFIGLTLVLVGIALNATLIQFSDFPERSSIGGQLALALIAANLFIRSRKAIHSGQPRIVQKTVGIMLMNIIFIDATMVFAATGSSQLATLVVALVIPALLLKRFIPLS